MSDAVNKANGQLNEKLQELEQSPGEPITVSRDELVNIIGGVYMAQRLSTTRIAAECGGCTCNVTVCCKSCTP
jgi:hypothetical protein